MTINCPTCGHPLKESTVALDMLPKMPFSRREQAIVAVLAKAYPKPVTIDRLVFAIYADDIDGGPENAGGTVRQFISRIRQRLPEYGWRIPPARTGRGNAGEYRLEAVEEAES